MAVYDHDDDQISMANGDEWYFDEFGEYRNSKAELPDEDLKDESIVTDEFGETPASAGSKVGGDILADDEFNETLRSEYINDQLEDPNLQREAEADYDQDKMKDRSDT